MRSRSLVSRLILAHFAVLGLMLAIALVLGGVALRRYEHRTASDNLQALAAPLALEANVFYRPNGVFAAIGRNAIAQALRTEADEMDVRVLLFDQTGSIVFDSDDALIGQAIPDFTDDIDNLFGDAGSLPTGGVRTIVPVATRQAGLDGQLVVLAATRSPNVVTAIATPRPRLPVIRRLAPSLLVAFGIATLVAIVAAVSISRRIAAPISQLTRAAESMRRGELRQHVAPPGDDEIGLLVRSFNEMSRQVSAIDAQQRDFLAGVAHDLRTPLTAITGYVQAMRDGLITDPAAVARTLDTVSAESDRMARLLSDLLELARLQAGQLQFAETPVDLQHLIASAVARFEPAAQAKQITIDQRLHPATVRGDRDRLGRVLDNLLANAIRHVPSGGSIVISVESLGDEVEIAVLDSGPGFPPELLPRLFERYAGGQRSEQRYGLGLAIAREIITVHGGKIVAENRPEGGAEVRIKLPIS